MAAPLPEGDLKWLPSSTSDKPVGKNGPAGVPWAPMNLLVPNYQDNMLNYFRARFGDAYIGDRTKFKIRPTIPPNNCSFRT